jgi:hypothetical protein
LDQPSQTIQNKEIRADKFATEQIINDGSTGAKPVAEAVLAVSNNVVVGDMLRSVKSAVSSYEVDKDAWGIFDGKLNRCCSQTPAILIRTLDFKLWTINVIQLQNDMSD